MAWRGLLTSSPPGSPQYISQMATASGGESSQFVSPALTFDVIATQGRARTSRMTLPHFTAETPMFMPVGTQGEAPFPIRACQLIPSAQSARCARSAHASPALLSGYMRLHYNLHW